VVGSGVSSEAAGRRRTVSRVALVLAGAVGVALVVLAFVAPVYEGSTTTTLPDGSQVTDRFTRSLVEQDGWWGAAVMAVPLVAAVLVAILLRATGPWARRLVWLPVLALFAFSVVALSSVGLAMLPVVVLLGVAAAAAPRTSP
jgi:hypothetical protein